MGSPERLSKYSRVFSAYSEANGLLMRVESRDSLFPSQTSSIFLNPAWRRLNTGIHWLSAA